VRVLVTGAAGFIGFHVARRLVARGDEVLALDVLNDYYDPSLKRARLEALGVSVDEMTRGQWIGGEGGLRFVQADLQDQAEVLALLADQGVDAIVHLAAQVGVRYAAENPRAYADSNLSGFLTVLEAARGLEVQHLVYASSSSVYGDHADQPFKTSHRVDAPVSFYAATKRANELMAHSYAHLYGVPTTGLRFFTVYGPWGRPDMALFKFVDRILRGEAIDIYNHGDLSRDFTYVDDVVEGVVRVLDGPPTAAPPIALYNIGNTEPVALMDFVAAVEQAVGREATKRMLPMQPGDVSVTWADCAGLERDFGYRPQTPLHDGVQRFVDWYRDFYGR
jgi:UDP-glucuronate 4-epimerase